MASISTDSNGNRTLQFVAGDGKRRSIRLGKIPKKTADSIRIRVEYLNAAAAGNTPLDVETAAWVSKIGDDLHSKLAAVGLVPGRVPTVVTTLGEFCDNYIVSRSDVKPNTKRNLIQSRKYLTGFFGEGRELRSINQADADRFGFHMKGKYAEFLTNCWRLE